MKTVTTTIRENRQISPDFYLLTFSWEAAWGVPVPGNFLELKVNDSTAPLLRRPFAFSDYDPQAETASMIYQVRGTSTQLLTEKKAGDAVKIIGPLGNGFTLDTDRNLFAVAGGVGLGPILFAAKEAQKMGKKVTFITGFRSANLIPDRSLWNDLDAIVCTDDGSEGFAGNTVAYLGSLDTDTVSNGLILSCGPTPMLRACHHFAEKTGIACEVSMEELMACGIGACMGCVCETKTESGLSRVCKEGPVFSSEVIKWN